MPYLLYFQISPTVENPQAYEKIKIVLLENGFLPGVQELTVFFDRAIT